jgi:hypothetical protein
MMNRDIGSTVNMVKFCWEGNYLMTVPNLNGLNAKEAREEILMREIANCRLLLLSAPIVEAQSLFVSDSTLSCIGSALSKHPNQEVRARLEESLKIKETIKRAALKKIDVKHYYEELLPLAEATRCSFLPAVICQVALNIPPFSHPLEMEVSPFLDDPRTRLDLLLDVFNEMQKMRPLTEWSPISRFVSAYHEGPQHVEVSEKKFFLKGKVAYTLLSLWLSAVSGLETFSLTASLSERSKRARDLIPSIVWDILYFPDMAHKDDLILECPIKGFVAIVHLKKKPRRTVSKHVLLWRNHSLSIRKAFFVPENVFENWIMNFVLTLTKWDILTGCEPKLIPWDEFDNKDKKFTTELRNQISAIRSAEADPWIEDRYKELKKKLIGALK